MRAGAPIAVVRVALAFALAASFCLWPRSRNAGAGDGDFSGKRALACHATNRYWQQPGADAQLHTGTSSGLDTEARLQNLLADHQYLRIQAQLDQLTSGSGAVLSRHSGQPLQPTGAVGAAS